MANNQKPTSSSTLSATSILKTSVVVFKDHHIFSGYRFFTINSRRSAADHHMSEGEKPIQSSTKDQNSAPTTGSSAMDKIQSSVLKTVIEGIPLLSMDNYTHWRRRVYNFLDVVKLKVSLTTEKGIISDEENDFLKAIIVAKLESTVQANVVDSINEDDARLIWKAIVKFFASNQASNKARVFQSFLRAPYTPHDIPGFITTMKNFQSQLIEVGWTFADDAIGHMVIHKFPAEMNDIVNQITHSDKEPTIDVVFEHLRVHEHNLEIRASGSGSKANPISLFTEEDKKCRRTAHNPKATGHNEANCWMLHPHLRPAEFQKRNTGKSESSVSSFHTSLSKSPQTFILDSGSSAHMISNPHLFFTLEVKELGCVQTSSTHNLLKIKGTGTVRLKNKYGNILLKNVLYIPDLVVNLLSVRCLILEDYVIQFNKNSFEIVKDNEIKMTGTYTGNLPSLEFENIEHSSHLSSAEFLHKSLGHIVKNCESCAVSKITKASFKSVHKPASRPFEEVHLDLMGPIWPPSYQGHRFILTVVDSCTRFCAAIPVKLKSDVAETISFLVDIEAKRLGTILEDSGIERKYWNEIAKVSSLTLNQIPTHRTKKSPFELFKGRCIPLNYFYPIGNRVSFLIQPEQSFSKLKPKGKLGKLIGYTDELQSYRILSDEGRIVETKNVQFLEYSAPDKKSSDWDPSIDDESGEEESSISEERLDEQEAEEFCNETVPDVLPLNSALEPAKEDSNIRNLRERTTQVKPIKYSYLTADPTSFKNAMKSSEKTLWRNATDEELSNIEHHEVWEDEFKTPDSFLRTLWDHITLSQEKLIDKGLKMLGLTECKSVNTPLSVGVQFKPATQEEKEEFSRLGINYRTFTGILNYLSCRTRPDLAPAVSILSSFNNDPGITHWKEVIHCWKYVNGTRNLHLKLRPSNSDVKSLQHFTDATWADDLETRISRSGSICFWKQCPIAWNSKRQRNIALSSTEAELNALADGVQENQWIKFLVEELWDDKLNPTNFHIDNQGLAEKIKNFGSNSKTKHLDIKMKWLRDLKDKNEIAVTLIPSEKMIADTLTKASNLQSLTRLREKCFLVHYSPS
ncbi:hypothetical protein VP01_508g2 [Puccinia sorghi]|uniref:Integrase catalytic domain-containing protein n=1 Tax=Puccinia sorghi TaxID=27349 RepID=A0A0L6UM19_9BASI|nr:hypothetical protein VP01_508g2 [Puccinia sorghi]